MTAKKKTTVLILVIAALLIADTLVSVFCTRAVMLKNASQQPQNNGEAKVETRLLPGETTHRLSASAETVMVDSFLQKPDEMLFMDDSVHRVSEEDADALYRVILNMMESYPGDILRSTYVPDATEEDFRQYGALEFRFQKYYSYSYQMEEQVLSGTEDALWVFFYKGYPCLVPVLNGRAIGLYYGPGNRYQTDADPKPKLEYQETVKNIMQKNGWVTPEWQE